MWALVLTSFFVVKQKNVKRKCLLNWVSKSTHINVIKFTGLCYSITHEHAVHQPNNQTVFVLKIKRFDRVLKVRKKNGRRTHFSRNGEYASVVRRGFEFLAPSEEPPPTFGQPFFSFVNSPYIPSIRDEPGKILPGHLPSTHSCSGKPIRAALIRAQRSASPT